jgi:hypothetical protein
LLRSGKKSGNITGGLHDIEVAEIQPGVLVSVIAITIVWCLDTFIRLPIHAE